MEITFQNPVFLWFLALIPLLVAIHLYSLRFARQKAMRFANFEALEKIVKGGRILPKNYALLGIRILTLVGFTLAAAGITLQYDIIASSYDYVIAIDTSNSMLAQDFSPNRISAVRSAVSDWVKNLPEGSQVGVVEFSTNAKVLSEPTTDLKAVSRKILEIYPERSGGTAICEALKIGTNLLLKSDRPRAIFLLSDGQNNAGCRLEEGISYAKENNVSIFAIGVGSVKGAQIEGLDGEFFKLGEVDLKLASASTYGKYWRAEGNSGLKNIFDGIDMTAKKRESRPISVEVMILSFVFVFVDWGLSITRYRAIP